MGDREDRQQWMEIDLGAQRLLYPTHYTLQHHRHDAAKVLRNWVIEARIEPKSSVKKDANGKAPRSSSNSRFKWVTLSAHKDDLDMLAGRGMSRVGRCQH